jgi:hypothetical protein
VTDLGAEKSQRPEIAPHQIFPFLFLKNPLIVAMQDEEKGAILRLCACQSCSAKEYCIAGRPWGE